MDDKTCTLCGLSFPKDSFPKMGKNRDGSIRRRANCLDCKHAVDKKQSASSKGRKRLERAVQKRKETTRSTIAEYLRNNPCIDCGEEDIVVLEFDHVRGQKIAAISTMVSRHSSMESILSEIEKCEVRCANCHRRATAKRGNWHNTRV